MYIFTILLQKEDEEQCLNLGISFVALIPYKFHGWKG